MTTNGFAHCKRMAIACAKELTPFRFNGQLNQVVLTEGESAELNMIFQGGKKYRISACGGRFVKNLGLKLFDRNKQLIFDNADHNNAQYWDFENGATQNMTIEVKYPEGNEGYNDVTAGGCVALVVGFLE